MAYKKNLTNDDNASTRDLNKNLIDKDKTSSEADFSVSNDDAILDEIQNVLSEGSYRKKETTLNTNQELAQDEDSVAKVDFEIKEEKVQVKKIKNAKTKKEKKNYEKTTLMHKMKVLGALLVLGVFTGSGLGVWYFNSNLRSNVNYSDYKVADYVANVGDVFTKNFGLSDINDKAWREKVANKTPGDVSSPIDNFLIAVQNATLADTFIFTGNGKAVTMGITQTVYSQRRYNGSAYSFESISKGTLTVANCDYYEKGGSQVDIYTGSDVSQRDAKWGYSETMTAAAYEDMTGSLPSGITPYIISDKTVKNSSMEYDQEKEQYKITFDLHPVTSALLYYKEVRRTGGLEAAPEFYSIKYIATIDKDWNLVTTEVVEEYKAVKFSVGVTCYGSILIEYLFNVEVVMHDLVKG